MELFPTFTRIVPVKAVPLVAEMSNRFEKAVEEEDLLLLKVSTAVTVGIVVMLPLFKVPYSGVEFLL